MVSSGGRREPFLHILPQRCSIPSTRALEIRASPAALGFAGISWEGVEKALMSFVLGFLQVTIMRFFSYCLELDGL